MFLLFMAWAVMAQDSGSRPLESLEKLVKANQKSGDKAQLAKLLLVPSKQGVTELSLSPNLQACSLASNELKIKMKDRRAEIASLQCIGKTHFEMCNDKLGLDYLYKALELAKEINARPRITETYYLLAEAYEKLNDPLKSLQYMKIYMAMKDSLINESMTQKMSEDQTMYYLSQTDSILVQKNQEIRTIYVISIIGTFFALCIVLWLTYTKMSHQYALNDELKQKTLLIEQQNHQLERLLKQNKAISTNHFQQPTPASK